VPHRSAGDLVSGHAACGHVPVVVENRRPVTDGRDAPRDVGDRYASAAELERDDPALVARTAEDLRTGAEADLQSGVPRGRAYIRRLQELTVERSELGIAVGRSLGLEHIVEELLEGITVEGVAGIGPDGSVLPPTRRHRNRRRGVLLLVISGLLLLVEAVIADGLASAILYTWTAVGLGLFFVGCYLVTLRE
jgi:hypothetical protein